MKNEAYEYIDRMLFDKGEKTLALMNGAGKELNFEQVFAMEYENGIYCILRPLVKVEGLNAHTAIAFSVNKNGALRVVKNKRTSDKIFPNYYALIVHCRESLLQDQTTQKFNLGE